MDTQKRELLYREELSNIVWVAVVKNTYTNDDGQVDCWMELYTAPDRFRNIEASFNKKVDFEKAVWLADALKRAAEFAIKYEFEHAEEFKRDVP